MKTSELDGHLLDYWTGRALGKSVQILKHQRDESYFCSEEYAPGDVFIGRPTLKLWNPSEDWSIGGPLIERHLIEVERVGKKWKTQDETFGTTLLIANCRAIIKFHIGDEVPDEGEKE